MFSRRSLLTAASTGAALAGVDQIMTFARHVAKAEPALDLSRGLPDGARKEALLDRLPGKKPLIKLSYRPPNYETPIDYFKGAITPNDVFFVRYHLANIH